jgi:putative pyruvate formate lyase activating enzyme
VSKAPRYLALFRSGELDRRAAEARARLRDCDLCGRRCHVDRVASVRGAVCRTGVRAVVHGFGPHHGEEGPIRGTCGSGTVFFSWCNLRCDFCQNWEIARRGEGREVSDEALARIMLSLQEQGCHNVNLVSPSHVVAQVLSAIAIAARAGLCVPIVYNTGGYDSETALRLLDGVIDVYMPDLKYGDDVAARRWSHVRDYVSTNQAAVREMHRQVGDLRLDDEGVAVGGLLVRHLILPGDVASSGSVLRFLAEEVSRDTYVNLMGQYRPCYLARTAAPMDRRILRGELESARSLAAALGLCRLDPGC